VSSIVNIYYFYSAQKLSHFGLLFYGDFLTFNTSAILWIATFIASIPLLFTIFSMIVSILNKKI
ncbi:hypothetical protein, partial [Chroococcidiopsis sp [FACHB-1243]]|uniref:hypothetical protein n=1 Tax=Chroococcidiopsis sp. [FACHB-1243] TaxID=2692781 RepID=UPI001A7EAA67